MDDIGLDLIDREVLKAIIQKFNGGPVGIDTISASISEERATIEDICEPYLMQIGFISVHCEGGSQPRRLMTI